MLHVEDAAHEGEAVGVHAARGDGDNRVARAHCGAVEYLRPVDYADGEAREVVLVLAVEAGHLGGLAAYERRAGLYAALGDAGDYVRDALGHVPAAGDVVEKEHGRGAAADDVVHAHGDAVYADGVVLVHEEGYLQLRADAVRAGDEDGLRHARKVGPEEAAEAAEAAEHAGGLGALNVLFHELHGLVAGGDVDAGGAVACALAYHSFSSFSRSLNFCSKRLLAARLGISQG